MLVVYDSKGRAYTEDDLARFFDHAEGALSQQAKAHADPTDTYTAVDMATAAAQGFRDGQAAVEQAPAQDEREAPIVVATAILGGLFHGGSGPELGEIDIEVCTPSLETIQCETVNSSDDVFLPLMTVAQHERIVAALARPAQTEQQPEQRGYLPLSLTELLQRYKRDLELRTFPDNDEGDYQLRWTAKEIARVNAALSSQGGRR